MLRAESLARPGDKIACGTPSPVLHFTSDWVVQALVTSAAPSVDIVASRTLDNALVNYALLKQARQTWATVLAEGPGRVTFEPGLPDLTRLVTSQPAPQKSFSTFTEDFLLPVPDSFVDGARIPLPEPGVGALLGVFAAQHLPQEGVDGDGVLASASLSGGRPGSPPPRVTLVRDDSGPAIVFELPDESAHGRQRTFRAALNVLRNMARLGRRERTRRLDGAGRLGGSRLGVVSRPRADPFVQEVLERDGRGWDCLLATGHAAADRAGGAQQR